MDIALSTAIAEIEHLQAILHSYAYFFLIFDVVFFLAVFVIILLAFVFLKSRHKLRTSGNYLRYTIRGQEEERARIARELHDTVAQDLRYCKSLGAKISDDSLREQLCRLLDKSIAEIRSMSYNLAPPDVTRNNLAANVMDFCQAFSQQSETTFRMVATDSLDTSFLTEEENLNLYRIVQESLNNILKHAKASEVTVLMRNQIGGEEKGLYIFITDDGVGFDARKNYASGMSHFGLVGMKQRADFIGAKLSISSEPGDGSQITIVKPKPLASVKEGTIKFK